eukprot:1425664-Amphidinium_carterae.1
MLEGRWDTWSYADLMIHEVFFEMLTKDSFRQEKLDMSQKQFKWLQLLSTDGRWEDHFCQKVHSSS